MPPGGLREEWLNPELTDPAEVRELLAAMPEPGLQPRRVSSAVNSPPKNNTPDLVAAVSD